MKSKSEYLLERYTHSITYIDSDVNGWYGESIITEIIENNEYLEVVEGVSTKHGIYNGGNETNDSFVGDRTERHGYSNNNNNISQKTEVETTTNHSRITERNNEEQIVHPSVEGKHEVDETDVDNVELSEDSKGEELSQKQNLLHNTHSQLILFFPKHSL